MIFPFPQKPSKYWEFVQELMCCIADYEIDDVAHVNFIVGLYEHLDPYQPEEELSLKQLQWLEWMWNKYCNGSTEEFEEWF